MDYFNKIEEITEKNKSIFNKILGESIIQKNNSGLGYYVNGNYVYRMGSDGTEAPYVEETWLKKEYSWLINSNFEADYIYFFNHDIQFRGKWNDGVFRGYEFMGSSYFYDGEFRGKIYNSSNEFFKALPDQFYSGVWMNAKNGILGIEPYEKDLLKVSTAEIVAVPVGWFVEVVGFDGKQVYFEIVKKIDEDNTDFIFRTYPDLNDITIEWENIREDYLNKGFVISNKEFNLLGSNYYINTVSYINVSKEKPLAKSGNVNIVDFSLDSNLKNFLSYKNVPMKIEIESQTVEGKNFVEQLKKDIVRGEFSSNLKNFKLYISSGIIRGFYNDKYVYLSKLFNNIKGYYNHKLNPEAINVLEYFNKFMLYIVGDVKNVNTNSLITESIIKMGDFITKRLQNFLEINKYIYKKSYTNVKQHSGDLNQNIGDIEDSDDEKNKQIIKNIRKILKNKESL